METTEHTISNEARQEMTDWFKEDPKTFMGLTWANIVQDYETPTYFTEADFNEFREELGGHYCTTCGEGLVGWQPGIVECGECLHEGARS